jgi:hypothetical protein
MGYPMYTDNPAAIAPSATAWLEFKNSYLMRASPPPHRLPISHDRSEYRLVKAL